MVVSTTMCPRTTPRPMPYPRANTLKRIEPSTPFQAMPYRQRTRAGNPPGNWRSSTTVTTDPGPSRTGVMRRMLSGTITNR